MAVVAREGSVAYRAARTIPDHDDTMPGSRTSAYETLGNGGRGRQNTDCSDVLDPAMSAYHNSNRIIILFAVTSSPSKRVLWLALMI
jgi:hypothetical protein